MARLPSVHLAPLTAVERRVLGCLIEKRFTTPEQYPLSLNALRVACNQSTNREPVMQLDEGAVRDAAQRLARYGLARLASGHTSRATKYRHLAHEALRLEDSGLAVLCVLLLRGSQTPGELKGRTERMVRFASLADVEAVLEGLQTRGYARRIPRRPGQKEDRFEQTLGQAVPGDEHSGSADPDAAPASGGAAVSPPAPPVAAPSSESDDGGLHHRVGALEDEIARLRAELQDLRARLDQ